MYAIVGVCRTGRAVKTLQYPVGPRFEGAVPPWSAGFLQPAARDRSTRLAAMSSHVSKIDPAPIGTAIADARVFARTPPE
ncbi:hypothetical protein [Burkholderia lata]|uniref:hypothetical protein n=1 Tax=Burkholderia lata (strain ATCC 17760 / DSM 23089 / LMG 22485 / NCIMB 9086 / R18194 / 383) TaxID=482957 RepID=UPI0015842EB2|nr:hypothetical protein [Burkholderia lata]